MGYLIIICSCRVPANTLTPLPCFCVCMFGITKGNTSGCAPPSPNRHTLSSLRQGEEQYSATTTRWQCSHNNSDLRGPQADSPSGVAAQRNTTSWSNEGRSFSFRQIRSEIRESSSADSEGSDTVFTEQISVRSQRPSERLNTAPPRRRASLHQPQERSYRSLCTPSRFTENFGGLEKYYENDDHERRRPKNQEQEGNYRAEHGAWNRTSYQNNDSRLVQAREKKFSRSESVRLHDRRRHSGRDLARTWTYRDPTDKHVHFHDDTRSTNRHQDESREVWEMLGQVLKERGVPVRFGGNGAPLKISRQSSDSQVLHRSEASCSDSQPHQRVFQRAATSRHSFHGDIRERRRFSHRDNSGRDHRVNRDRHHDNVEHDGEVYEISSKDSYVANRQRQDSRRLRENKHSTVRERNESDSSVRRTTSRHLHRTIEESLSTEEEQELERRVERPHRRVPQRSQSLSSRASTRNRSRRMAAGTVTPWTGANSNLQREIFQSCARYLSMYICSSHLPSITIKSGQIGALVVLYS